MTKISLIYEFDDEKQLRAHLDGQTRSASVTIAPVSVDVDIVAELTSTETVRSAADLDSDGMPYDAEFHADPPSVTKDGTWRAKRGKSAEADAARAAFKARGGAVTPPPALPPAAAAAPALPPAAAALPPSMPPSMPPAAAAAPALPPSMPEPVDILRLYDLIVDAGTRKLVETSALYQQFCGTVVPTEIGEKLNADETLRRKMFDHLVSLGATG
jgi:hypothetical protein